MDVPTIQLTQVGGTALGDVYEVQPAFTFRCFDAHPKEATVQTPETAFGTVFLCGACGAFWLVPRSP